MSFLFILAIDFFAEKRAENLSFWITLKSEQSTYLSVPSKKS